MPNFDHIEAPWTPQQVAALNIAQENPSLHPFTCPSRNDGKHENHASDLGALVATINGWICVYCDYTQNWAYEMFLDTFWLKPWTLTE